MNTPRRSKDIKLYQLQCPLLPKDSPNCFTCECGWFRLVPASATLGPYTTPSRGTWESAAPYRHGVTQVPHVVHNGWRHHPVATGARKSWNWRCGFVQFNGIPEPTNDDRETAAVLGGTPWTQPCWCYVDWTTRCAAASWCFSYIIYKLLAGSMWISYKSALAVP